MKSTEFSPITAVEAWLDIAVADVHVRLAPFHAVRHAIRPPHATFSMRVPVLQVETFRAVSAIHLLRPACLTKALAMLRFLRRRRVAAVLCMGLGNDHVPSGHAWVEVGGATVGESAGVATVFGRMTTSNDREAPV